MADRLFRTVSAALAVAGLAAGAGCASGSSDASSAGQGDLGGVSQRAIDPCTLLTGPDLEALLGTAKADPAPDGQTHSVCLLTGRPAEKAARTGRAARRPSGLSASPTPRRTESASAAVASVRVTLMGDADTAAAVYDTQLHAGPDPERVPEVGRAAFVVTRSDEVGIVALTPRAVLGVSVLTERPIGRDRDALLDRLVPVVRRAAGRL